MFSLNSFRSTPYNLQFIFAGRTHEWQYNATFAPGNTFYQIKTPQNLIMHITNRVLLTQSTSLNFQLRKNSVISVQGTSTLFVFNVNRTSNTTSKTKIFTNPSATSGSIIENILLISKSPFVQQSPELILKSDTDYTMKITNSAGTNQVLNLNFVWYESNN